MNTKDVHIPVLFSEVLETLALKDFSGPRIVLDATLGLGGHACGVIELLNSSDTFIGLDADSRNLQLAQENITTHFAGKTDLPQMHFVHNNFLNLSEVLKEVDIHELTHVYYDLGVNSVHYDLAEGGFSFRQEAPLDMRFDRTSGEKTAAKILETSTLEELTDIFKNFGEEKRSYYIARKVCEVRENSPIETTTQLADIIGQVSNDPKAKTRIFQALRIAVNSELENLTSSLKDVLTALASGGIVGVIAFHSLEDRIVKNLFRHMTTAEIDEHTGQDVSVPDFVLPFKKPIVPSDQEIEANPRSRSAKLRTIQKR